MRFNAEAVCVGWKSEASSDMTMINYPTKTPKENQKPETQPSANH